MPTIEVEFEVFCSCGAGLCNQATTNNTSQRCCPGITVEPCQKCLDEAEKKGHEDGYDSGYTDGQKENT